MKTLLVYREDATRERFESLCRDMDEVEVTGAFQNPAEAVEYAKHHQIELAVVDMTVEGADCLDLGVRLKLLQRGMVLVFLAAERERVADVLGIRADYCIMAPMNRADMTDMIERARLLSYRQKKARAVMFGRFQLFVGSSVVNFGSAKSKELLALCLDHVGGEVRMEEAIDKLWPGRLYDERVKKLYRKAVMNLQSTLRESGVEDIFETRRGVCYVVPRLIECDYFSYLNSPEQNRLFAGEYLFDYGWAEEKLAKLYILKDRTNTGERCRECPRFAEEE